MNNITRETAAQARNLLHEIGLSQQSDKKNPLNTTITQLTKDLFICKHLIQNMGNNSQLKYDSDSHSWKDKSCYIIKELAPSIEGYKIFNDYTAHLFDKFSNIFPQKQDKEDVRDFLNDKFLSTNLRYEQKQEKINKFFSKISDGKLKNYNEKNDSLNKKIQKYECKLNGSLIALLIKTSSLKNIFNSLDETLNAIKGRKLNLPASEALRQQLETTLNTIRTNLEEESNNFQLRNPFMKIDTTAFKDIDWECLWNPNNENFLNADAMQKLESLRNDFESIRQKANTLKTCEKKHLQNLTENYIEALKAKKTNPTQQTQTQQAAQPPKSRKKKGFFSTIGSIISFFPKLIWKGITKLFKS